MCRLVQQVTTVWPGGRPAHRVADRAFPGSMLCRTLRGVHGDWMVGAGTDGQGSKARSDTGWARRSCARLAQEAGATQHSL